MSGRDMVIAERRRQQDVEGYTRQHDVVHGPEVLERAAMSYAAHGGSITPPAIWPWNRMYWKPKNRLQNLIRAGALFQAAGEVCPPFDSMRHWGQRDVMIAQIDALVARSGD